MDIHEAGYEKGIMLQDMVQWWALVNIVMKEVLEQVLLALSERLCSNE